MPDALNAVWPAINLRIQAKGILRIDILHQRDPVLVAALAWGAAGQLGAGLGGLAAAGWGRGGFGGG